MENLSNKVRFSVFWKAYVLVFYKMHQTLNSSFIVVFQSGLLILKTHPLLLINIINLQDVILELCNPNVEFLNPTVFLRFWAFELRNHCINLSEFLLCQKVDLFGLSLLFLLIFLNFRNLWLSSRLLWLFLHIYLLESLQKASKLISNTLF